MNPLPIRSKRAACSAADAAIFAPRTGYKPLVFHDSVGKVSSSGRSGPWLSAIALPDAAHSSSTMSRLLKEGRGMERRSAAIPARSLTSAGQAGASTARVRAARSEDLAVAASCMLTATIWSIARLSSSEIGKLFMTAPHLAAQILESAKLKLLDGSLTSSE